MQVVQQQIAQLSQQYGGQIPQQVQQQIMNEAESQVAQIVAVVTNKMVQEETEGMSQQAQDPIIELKNKELDLRAAEFNVKLKNL